MTRKRILGVILTLVIVLQCISVMSVTVSAEESVSTAEQLADALEDGSSFILTANIDMAGKTVTPCAVNGITVDGDGYVIKNLVTTTGMYTSATNCTFKDLFLYNCKVVNNSAGSGYGLIAGTMTGGSVMNCGAAGEMAIYGANASNVGGIAGSTNGTSITSSFAMVDIYTDASYVGGLVGRIGSAAATVETVYSTGNIINSKYDHVGGLFGSSAVSVSNSYTTVFIENAYADTVKAIGCLENGASLTNVYYDRKISLQRQADLDSSMDISNASALTSNGFTALENGYYYLSGMSSFAGLPLAYISASKVDLDNVSPGSLTSGSGTGREYVPVSTLSSYNSATLTVNANVTWDVSGGSDEYFFDPSNLVDAYGNAVNGLSGNAYDSITGKYLFVNPGDVTFTAKNGGFERTIYVHVKDANPYFSSGSGTQTSPFLITDRTTLDNVRLYCLDGSYYYKLSGNIDLGSGNDKYSGVNAFTPIAGFKGNFDGNGKTLSGMTVSSPNGGGAGLFATVTGSASISSLHIANANAAPLNGTAYASANAGLLCGTVSSTGVAVSDVLVSGKAGGSANSGLLIGDAGQAAISRCAAIGDSAPDGSAVSAVSGGIVGTSSGSLTDCYSSAVVKGTAAGGIAGSGGSYTNCLFTGMFRGSQTVYPIGPGSKTNSYYDAASTAIPSSDSNGGKTTVELSSAASLLGASWTHGASDGLYPYISSLNGKWSDAIIFAARPVTYQMSGASWLYNLSPSSRSFNTAAVDPTGVTFVPDPTGAYIRSSGTFTKAAGGEALYGLNFTSAGATDYRSLYFNVSAFDVYIKYVFNGTNYGLDGFGMDSAGITSVTTDWGDSYNISDRYVSGTPKKAVTLPAIPSALAVSAVLPAKGYDASVTAKKNAENGADLPVSTASGISRIALTGDTSSVYITVTVSAAGDSSGNFKPWGVFRDFCRKLVPPAGDP